MTPKISTNDKIWFHRCVVKYLRDDNGLYDIVVPMGTEKKVYGYFPKEGVLALAFAQGCWADHELGKDLELLSCELAEI